MSRMLKYGDGQVAVNLPESCIAYTVEPNPVTLEDAFPEELIGRALDNPIGTLPIEQLVKPGESVCLVVSDGTRAWQKPGTVLRLILDRLNRAGVSDKDVFILSARGTHRPQTDAELRALVTPEVYDRVASVKDHDPKNDAELVTVGTTSRGTVVRLNAAAVRADRVILVGSVLHHFLAGFSGGRKSVLPGLAAATSVQSNHSLSLAAGGGFDPLVRSGNLENNPVHEDMCEAARMLAPDFIVNTVVDEEYRLVQVFAGDIFEAHKAACALVDRMNCVEIPCRCPVVIASAGGYPKDINVYQPLKTLCHMLECVEPGGTIIMLSESREGFGSPDAESQMKDYDDMESREKALRAHYTIGAATGYLYADAAERYNFIYVTCLPASEFSHTKMKIASSLDEALAMIPAPGDRQVCLMSNGSVTLPKLKGN